MKTTCYGIKLNGKPLGFCTSSNKGDFCVDVEFELEQNSDKIWLVKNKEIAEKAKY